MRAMRLSALILSCGLVLSGCTAAQDEEPAPLEADFDSMISTADYREQVVPAISLATSNAPTNTPLSARASFALPGGEAPLAAWVRLQVATDLQISTASPGDWDCDPAEVGQGGRELLCRVDEGSSAEALSAGLPLTLVTASKPGLFGITVQAGYGDPPSTSLGWEEAAGRSDAARTIIKVVAAVESPAPLLAKSVSRKLTQKPEPIVSLAAAPIAKIKPEPLIRLASVQPTDSFCLLYAAIGASGGKLSAGPIEFSNLGSSSATGTTCTDSSVITLSSADIKLGSITFSNVTGTVTPTSITIQTSVADGEVDLTISGPYPETGSEYSATAQFKIGGTPIAATGSVDYSVPDQLTIELDVSASDLRWSPLPGFSLASGGATGKFVRTGSGENEKDSFDLQLQFQGNWNPIGTVSTKAITVDLTNASGDLVASIDTSLSGGISVADLNLSVAGLFVDGSLDTDTGRTELNVDLEKISIGQIAEIGQSTASFVYDPNGSDGGNSVFISGSAAFEKNIASFFAGDSISTTIEFNDSGYLVSAEMDTAPDSAGFEIESLQFVYTSLIDPTVPFEYEPSYPEASGIMIPLANESPLVIGISRGLPDSFAKALSDLKINVIDPTAITVVAIELPPGVPKLAAYYGAPGQPYLIGNSSDSTYLRFDEVYLAVEAGAEDSFTIGGDVTLHTSNTDLLLESALTISVSETGAGIDGSLELIDSSGWKNAFGLSGLTVFDLLIQAGVDDGLPSFGIEATAEFPSSVTSPLGIVTGSVITLGLDLSATTPCAIFDIKPPSSNPGANVISLDGGTLTATDAELILAPEGCQLGQVTYSGYAMNFDGKIRDVGVGFATTFELTPVFSLQGSGYIDSFPLGSVTMDKTTANLSIDSAGFSLYLEGGLSAGSSIVAQGKTLLASNGGFTFDGAGTLYINGNGSAITLHATDCKDNTCSELTDPSFDVTGDVTINGFTFDVSLAADAKGDFKAKLTIPNHSHNFSFSNSRPKISGNGTFTYTISVEVSNTDVGEIDFSGSVKLKSCKITIVFEESCSGSKVTWSDKMSPGSVEVTIGIKIAGTTRKSSFKV